MPSVDIAGARRAAERCRSAVEALVVPSADGFVRVTLSGGVSTLQTDEDQLDELIRRADRALYRAKADGRNRIEVTTSDADAVVA